MKIQNETTCQGFLTHPRSHPPEELLSLGSILAGFSRHHDHAPLWSNPFYQKAAFKFAFSLAKYFSTGSPPHFQYSIKSGTIWSGFSAPCLHWRPDSDTSNCHSTLLCSDRSSAWLGHCAPTTARSLQDGFLHEEMATIPTWRNQNVTNKTLEGCSK